MNKFVGVNIELDRICLAQYLMIPSNQLLEDNTISRSRKSE